MKNWKIFLLIIRTILPCIFMESISLNFSFCVYALFRLRLFYEKKRFDLHLIYTIQMCTKLRKQLSHSFQKGGQLNISTQGNKTLGPERAT